MLLKLKVPLMQSDKKVISKWIDYDGNLKLQP